MWKEENDLIYHELETSNLALNPPLAMIYSLYEYCIFPKSKRLFPDVTLKLLYTYFHYGTKPHVLDFNFSFSSHYLSSSFLSTLYFT